MSSIRNELLSESLGPKARQPSISINVNNSITTDFGRHISGHDVEPTFDDRDTVRSKHLLVTPRLINVFRCRIQVSSLGLFTGSGDCRNQARSFSLIASREEGVGSTLDATGTTVRDNCDFGYFISTY